MVVAIRFDLFSGELYEVMVLTGKNGEMRCGSLVKTDKFHFRPADWYPFMFSAYELMEIAKKLNELNGE